MKDEIWKEIHNELENENKAPTMNNIREKLGLERIENNNKDEIKEKFYSLEELKRTIDCYDGYLDNEEVYYFIGALRFAYDYITNLQERNKELIIQQNALSHYLSKQGLTFTDIVKIVEDFKNE